MEGYLTLRQDAEAVGEFTDRKSRFIAHLVHVESAAEASDHLARVRARHFDARHNVPAWVLVGGEEHASDDGEPQRTSGMPTLEVLRGAGLRDVCCVTTRYFGGTLLGPGGLVRAYTAAAQEAVRTAHDEGLIVEMTLVTPVALSVPYARFEQVRDLVARTGGKVQETSFAADVELQLLFRAGDERAFVEALTERFAGAQDITVAPAEFRSF